MPRARAAPASTLTLPSDLEIRVERAFDAPLALVWKAFTDPTLLPHWMGPAKYKMTESRMDLRKGGAYRWAWDVPPQGLVIRGTFLEVDAPRRIVTEEFMEPFPQPSRNTLTFAEAGGRTTVSILIRMPTKEARDMALASGMKDGMDEGYGRLDALLAKGLR